MNPRAESVVAIDVGGTSLKGAVVDRRGRWRSLTRRPSRVAAGPEAVLEELFSLAAELAAAAVSPVAVGIAVPGLVEERTGTARHATNLGWRDVPLGALAAERLDAAVVVSHDVRAAAVAEGRLGAARGCSDYLLITLGTGVGAAMVLGGRPFTGAHGLGGELGHTTVEPDGPVCGCGNRGCLEALASAHHVAARYGALAGEPGLDAEAVARRAHAGDARAAGIWRRAIEALAIAVANYVTLLDPEVVVIGGGMAAAGGERLFAPLQRELSARLQLASPPPVLPALLGADAGWRGAAILAWREAGITEAELLAWGDVDPGPAELAARGAGDAAA